MSAFATLAVEALRDAIRRRIVGAIVVLSLISLLGIDSCTSCAGGAIVAQGGDTPLDFAGASGLTLFVTLGLWIIVLAGVLASDHLQEAIEDGSANLCLARPVSRGTFALARLAGALAVALGAGGVLLGSATALLAARSGLPISPALVASAHAALGAFCCAALAMTASLYLPRLAAVLLVLGGVGVMTFANLGALVPVAEGEAVGLMHWLDRVGPPLASGLLVPLDSWIPQLDVPGSPAGLGARLLAWGAASGALLVAAFRRIELGR